jgi:isopropylmalate/homocitrate/citramalate synthase
MKNSKKISRPWINKECFISPWAYQARQEMDLPKKVTIYDVTLRDGEQYPGLVFRKEDKIWLAKALDSLGIKRLEAGMPAVSQDDFDAAKEIVKRVKADVVVFSRAMRSDIDLALDVGAWGVIVEVPSNEKLINDGYVWEKKDVIEKAIDTCNYAKTKGLHTTFFLIDSSGADPEFLKSLIQDVKSKTDIDSITAVDTFGRLNPAGMKRLVQSMKKWAKIPVEVHVHNDFGLATANTLAAVEAGAEVVHTNMLGLGERSGGAPTEEIAVGLKYLYGLDPGLHFKKLMETGKIFQEVSGITVPGHKPVVGDNSFSYEAGIAAMFSYRLFKKGFPLGVVPFRAEEVGNEFKIAIGKKAGKYNVIWHLEKNGKTASEEQIERIVSKIKSESLRKKRALSNEEFLKIVEKIC